MYIGTTANNSILSNTRSSQKQMATHSNYLQGKNLEDMVITSPAQQNNKVLIDAAGELLISRQMSSKNSHIAGGYSPRKLN